MTNPPEFQVSSGGALALQPVAVARKTPTQLFWERLRHDKAALVGGVVIVILILIAIFGGPLSESITGHGQNADVQLHDRRLRRAEGAEQSVLVRRRLGRARPLRPDDVRRAHVTLRRHRRVRLRAVDRPRRRSRSPGFFGGILDTILSRGADVLLAVPQILIAVGVVAACSTSKNGCLGGLLQPGLPVVIAVIVFFSWSYIARIVRGYTLSLREKEFVESARAAGASNIRILSTEMLPNLLGPLIVYATLLIPTNILFEAAPLVPRPRSPAGPGIVGSDPQRRVRLLRRRLVAHALPGRVPDHHHVGLQSSRRRTA